jgi:hypothetical protein
MESKNPFQSKTLWTSLIIAIAAFFPSVQVIVSANPEIVGVVIGAVFGLLRIVSKKEVGLK